MRWKLSLSTNILQVILVTKRLLFFLNYLWNTASFKGIQVLSSLLHVIVSHFVDICHTNLRNCAFLFIFIVFLNRHTGKISISNMLSILFFFCKTLIYLLFLVLMLNLSLLFLLNKILQQLRLIVSFAIAPSELPQLLISLLFLISHNFLIFSFMLFDLIEIYVFLFFQSNFQLFFFSLLLHFCCSILLIQFLIEFFLVLYLC